MQSQEEMAKHHPWCNFYATRKVEDCSMCERFFKEYPINGRTPVEMAAAYFPAAKVVS